jgi:cation diffusion facilitator CzcD-associated flavoprotein CzcO
MRAAPSPATILSAGRIEGPGTMTEWSMNIKDERERVQVVVIGGGQAGLSVGYCLAQRGLTFVILDANTRIGDSWRQRWDSLRLFTPAKYDGLIGLPFPAEPYSFPTKDEMADYLELYARHFDLPVRSGVRVNRVRAKARATSWTPARGASRLTTW